MESLWLLSAALVGGGLFVAGAVFGARFTLNQKPEVIRVEKPFVVEKTVVKESSSAGFTYAKPGTPNPQQEQADRKLAELLTDPEL